MSRDGQSQHQARWPEILRRQACLLRAPGDASRAAGADAGGAAGGSDVGSPLQVTASHDQARGAVWLLIGSAIRGYLHMHSRRLGRVQPQDHEDIAADKSLDLLRKIESGQWRPESLAPTEIEAYFSAVARNGLVDRLREEERSTMMRDEETTPDHPSRHLPSPVTPPDAAVESREFVRSLRECAEQLSRQALVVWFFRVFYEMASKRIADHPEVLLKPGNVDVLLQRSRRMIRECMQAKGFSVREIPVGTFVELWDAFRQTSGLSFNPQSVYDHERDAIDHC